MYIILWFLSLYPIPTSYIRNLIPNFNLLQIFEAPLLFDPPISKIHEGWSKKERGMSWKLMSEWSPSDFRGLWVLFWMISSRFKKIRNNKMLLPDIVCSSCENRNNYQHKPLRRFLFPKKFWFTLICFLIPASYPFSADASYIL